MPFKMSVSCENRSRIQLPTPFTCEGILKMSFVPKKKKKKKKILQCIM